MVGDGLLVALGQLSHGVLSNSLGVGFLPSLDLRED